MSVFYKILTVCFYKFIDFVFITVYTYKVRIYANDFRAVFLQNARNPPQKGLFMKKIGIMLVVLLCLIALSVTFGSCNDTVSSSTPNESNGGNVASTPSETLSNDPANSSSAADDSDTPGTLPSDSSSSDDKTTESVTETQAIPPETTSETPSVTTTPEVTEPAVTAPETTIPEVTTPAVTTPETTAPEDITPEPEKGTSITVTYTISDPKMGSLIGKTTQTIQYGITKTSTVSATPNLGYRFVGWSDGVTKSTRSGESPRKNVTYTAIFEYDFKELPVLSLRTDTGLPITDKNNYVTGSISVMNAPEGYDFDYIPMQIRGRGNYTWGSTFNADERYNKRPYRIKLSEKKNLLGQGDGKAKVWVLIANHCDQSLLRNQTSYNFAKSLSGIIWQPSASSVEVFLNGEYIGVYMLSEQVQVNENRINLPEDYESSAEIPFLIQRSGYSEEPMFSIGDTVNYEIKNDLSVDSSLANRQKEYIRSRIMACWEAIQSGNQARVEALIDLNSVIDTYIVHELFKNLDTGWDNFYMFSDVDDVLHFGPIWDFDQCAGNADVGVEDYRFIRSGNENPWYRYLLGYNWFKEMLRDRWDELMPEIRKIPDTIHAYAESGYNSYCRNFDRWQIWGLKINRETDVIRNMHTYQEHVNYFAQWMKNRTDWMNNYYHSLEFLAEEVKLELNGSGTQSDPYRIETAKDFYNFTQMLGTNETFHGKYFKQTADINMDEISYYNGIGTPYVFAGIYNGNGHSITANISSNDSSFFPYVTGTVMNLVTAGSINNAGITGGIARSVRIGGKIVNCICLATLSSSGNVGGIVPSNETGGGTVVGCVFAGKILNAAEIGPINCYVGGRQGVFNYNYYVSDYTSPENQSRHTISSDSSQAQPDKAIERSALSGLAATLNSNLSRIASTAGIAAKDLCSWTFRNGVLALVSK